MQLETSTIPHLLLVAFHIPPDNSPGAIRAVRMVEQLSKRGWDIHVVASRQLSDAVDPHLVQRWLPTVPVTYVDFFQPYFALRDWWRKRQLRTQMGGSPDSILSTNTVTTLQLVRGYNLRSLLGRIAFKLYYPDINAAWIKPTVRTIINLNRENPFDVILTTAGPWSVLFVGYHASRATGIPWVADYRDPWTISSSRTEQMRFAFGAPRDRRWQQKFLDQCVVAHVVSEEVRDTYLQRYQVSVDKISVLPIGYDDLDLHPRPDLPPSSDEQFVIKYVGNMAMMVLEPFLQALSHWLETHPDRRSYVKLRFVGSISKDYQLEVSHTRLDDITTYAGVVSREAAWKETCSATILLLLWYATDKAHSPGSKVFTYLAAGRPILAVVPTGSGQRIVKESGQGMVVFYQNVPAIEHALEDLWTAWQKKQLEQHFPLNLPYLHQYSQSQLMEKLDRSLRAHLKIPAW